METTVRYLSAALLAVGIMTTATACATSSGPRYRYGGYGYGDREYYRYVERVAYDNGFCEGLEKGEKDGRSGRRYEPYRHGDWRDADEGYRRGYGDPELYRRSFRNGFEAGYSQAYSRYARYRGW